MPLTCLSLTPQLKFLHAFLVYLSSSPFSLFTAVLSLLLLLSRTFLIHLPQIHQKLDIFSSRTESLVGSRIDYQFLGISRARNQNISTEIVGDLIQRRSPESTKKGRPYSVATLDGTIMLVHDDIITWSIAVDHQIFSLHKMDVTGDGCDNIIACSWDGQTYILDQDKNVVKFQLEESVQSFDCGYYNLHGGVNSTCFVYATFHNKIYLYYDIPLTKMTCKRFEPDLSILKDLVNAEDLDQKSKNELVEYLLYGVKNV
uniref:Uncharacterized protein n=1 Tax=Photinus pyralis TaxID=7054 RepID=A0A1Y1KZH5_PHOPY